MDPIFWILSEVLLVDRSDISLLLVFSYVPQIPQLEAYGGWPHSYIGQISVVGYCQSASMTCRGQAPVIVHIPTLPSQIMDLCLCQPGFFFPQGLVLVKGHG